MASKAADNFRQNVAEILNRRNVTIAKMAEDLGASRPSLSRVVHGHENVTLPRAEEIAAYLGVKLADLLTRSKMKNSA